MFGFNDANSDKEKIIEFFKKNNLAARKIALIVIGFIFVGSHRPNFELF